MSKLKTPFVLNHGGGSDDHLSKFLKEFKFLKFEITR